MPLLVTISGDASNYLIRSAIFEVGASSYRTNVHLVPSASRTDPAQSAVSVVSGGGQTLEGVLDYAIARVITAGGAPVQNLEVRAAPLRGECSANRMSDGLSSARVPFRARVQPVVLSTPVSNENQRQIGAAFADRAVSGAVTTRQ